MKRFLLPESGTFYKANLHCHTVLSDGHMTPEQVKALYQELGYAIVAYTDHDLLIPHDDLTDDTFLALHGMELEISAPRRFWKTCHMCLIGIDPENIIQPFYHRSDYYIGNGAKHRRKVKFDKTQPDFVREYNPRAISKMMQTAREKGFFVTYNHPTWSKETYGDYMNYHGMHAMEISNSSCRTMGYEDYNPRVYDDMLAGGKKLYCIAADDNHNKFPRGTRNFDSGLSFTMIKADSLDYRTVTDALVEGHFYASEGPLIHALWVEDGRVHIRCSDADRVFITYDIRRPEGIVFSEQGAPVNEASFPLWPQTAYFRLTVVDKEGHHACTNAYFMDDLANRPKG